MKDDADYGTIAPGKIADLVIVNGNPAEHVSALAKSEKVVRGGRLYDIAELLKAVTFFGASGKGQHRVTHRRGELHRSHTDTPRRTGHEHDA